MANHNAHGAHSQGTSPSSGDKDLFPPPKRKSLGKMLLGNSGDGETGQDGPDDLFLNQQVAVMLNKTENWKLKLTQMPPRLET